MFFTTSKLPRRTLTVQIAIYLGGQQHLHIWIFIFLPTFATCLIYVAPIYTREKEKRRRPGEVMKCYMGADKKIAVPEK